MPIRSHLLVLFLGCVLLAQAPARKLHPELLVSTAWLADHLKDPDLVLLHVADTFADFKRGHIPGSRYLTTAKFIDNSGLCIKASVSPGSAVFIPKPRPEVRASLEEVKSVVDASAAKLPTVVGGEKTVPKPIPPGN